MAISQKVRSAETVMSVARSIVLLFIVVCVTQNYAARILVVVPTPSISHQVPFYPYVKELIRKGHEVTLLTTDPIYKKGEAPANLTEIDFHDMSYETWRRKFVGTTVTKGRSDDSRVQISLFCNLMRDVFEQQVKTKVIQDLVNDKSKQFDLLVLEAWVAEPLLFSHIYKAPVILFSSFGAFAHNWHAVGAPTHPLLHPPILHQRVYKLSLWEKIMQLYHHYKLEEIFVDLETKDDILFKELFGPDVPSVSELYNNVDMLFLNMHPIWGMNRPVPPNVIHIGGLHVNPPKELPKDIQSFLDSSENGVIYISFGTNVEPSLLPAHKIQSIVNVFSKLPYDVLWKWNQDELPGRSKNIRIEKWLPQTDLLKHPKIKAFVTQCGLQSSDEAISAGVPLVGVPLLGDQWYNSEQYVNLKIGVRVDMETLTEQTFGNALNEVINNTSYKKNIKILGQLYQDNKESSLERAMWWTDYVLRHNGTKHLRSPSANISCAEYFMLDVVLSAGTVFLLLSAVLAYIVSKVLRFIRGESSAKLKTK